MANAKAVPAYPLTWPITVPRTAAAHRSKSRFGNPSWEKAIADLKREITQLGGYGVVISTNQPIRNDGMPYAQTRRIDDPGVAVYFRLETMPVCMPCDRWATLAENMRAITLHIEAMRGQQRWGVGTAKQAFAGYAALPASTSRENWWDVLGLDRDLSTRDDIQAAYRARIQAAHPDHGGSQDAMARLNSARDEALAEVR